MSVQAGAVEARVASEFPGLELRWCRLAARAGPSTRALRARLRALSDRYMGARVIAMRAQPIAQAYRSFFRHTGLDPDLTRIPSEEAALGRLVRGGFHSRDRISDALLIALVETGVPVWALDGVSVDGPTLGIRTSLDGERLGAGEEAVVLGAGRLVVADAAAVHGLLFQPPVLAHAPTRQTEEIVVFSVGVGGVPTIYLEEALWLAGELLAET